MSTNAIFSIVCDGPDSEWKLGDYMKQMMLAGELNDVHFKVGRQFGPTQNFSAHKLVMAARSSVFRTMFYGSLPEKIHLDIPDIHPEAFANLLSFVYTDTVDNLDVGNVFATLCAAGKYDVPRLMKICSDFIANQLGVNNCLTILEQAIQWKADSVVQKCLDLVDAKSEAVLRSDPFTTIIPATLRMILQRNTLTARENAVYLAVERWAAAACARNGLDSSAANRRQMLGDALFLVRFPLLSPQQLADGPGQSGLLSGAEISSIFMHHNASLKPTAALVFPTERRTGSSSVAARGHVSGFKRDELVFARTDRGQWWLPAKVTVSDGMQLELEWSRSGMRHMATTDQVVRAVDILQPGQALHFLRADEYQPASYVTAVVGDLHTVSWDRGRVSIDFSRLGLLHQQVTHWKAKNRQ
ncbi:BTB/POZ domain-containing protein 6-like [Paramacrobiotus metropolitanus]|uniref:BTB/POZ domain-containing protein 6-like n=1 Tax=Paramacrobiotus metropolitanus TaxID=2943436 RepID=UPI002445A264|nr:BTB/POZ domain-containing protein 6-like [Paramacrobiotus metropolitanus]XP_055348098.1 BTB/POZ domain-containing protein 6-like [Paramacrobiotus metropolitanus]XP_055348100.1 BTB/POZ domain-containing protein 6-like [Paramacrobiotus metropolitanus]